MRYSSAILDHFYQPRNVGIFAENEQAIGRALLGSYDNGVVLQFQIKIMSDVIIAAKFKAYGNVATIAASSFATEWLTNKALIEAEKLDCVLITKALSLPEKKVHCALLVEDAVKKAIANYREA